MLTSEKLATPVWECVHFLDPGFTWADASSLEGQQILVVEADAIEVDGEQDLLDLIGEALKFPDYFGQNWDALDECLRDLSWMPAKGYVLVIRSAERLWREHPRASGALVQSWLFSAETWAAEGIPFHLVFLW